MQTIYDEDGSINEMRFQTHMLIHAWVLHLTALGRLSDDLTVAQFIFTDQDQR